MGANDIRYVNGLPGKGKDDPNPPWGLSPKFPWATIQFSVDQLAKIQGGTLSVAVAQYNENVQMHGRAYSNIGIVGAVVGAFDPNVPDQYCEARPVVDGQKKGRVFSIEDAVGISLKNLNIQHGEHDDGAGIEIKNAQTDLIECCIHDNTGTKEGGGGFAYLDCDCGPSRVEKCLVFLNTAHVSSTGAAVGSFLGAAGGAILVGGASAGLAAWLTKNPIVTIGAGIFGGIIGGGVGYKIGGSIAGTATAGKGRGGGGLILRSKNIEITKTKFWENIAEMTGGGALCLDHASHVTITDQNVFHDNKATLPSWQQGRGFATGGAILIANCDDAPSTIMIATQNTFENNNAEIRGGAIGIQDNSYVVISDQNVFAKNQAGVDGGAIAILERFSPPYTDSVEIMGEKLASHTVEVYDSTFNDNKADKGGGAIYASASTYLIVGKCMFNRNTADTEGGAIHASVNCAIESRGNGYGGNACNGTGGAISTRNSHLFVSDSNGFSGNVAGTFGGGIHFYTAEEGAFGSVLDVYLQNAKFVRARFVLTSPNGFLANQAPHGGAVSCRATRSKFPIDLSIDSGNNFVNNTGSTDGGGLHGFELDNPVVQGNGLQMNKAGSEGGGAYFENCTGLAITNNGFGANVAPTGSGLCIKHCGPMSSANLVAPVNAGLSAADISITP